jgi:hypothetical protein
MDGALLCNTKRTCGQDSVGSMDSELGGEFWIGEERVVRLAVKQERHREGIETFR